MPGYWEVTLAVTGVEDAPPGGEALLFAICVER
jgi:hypothetical protein